MVRHVGYEGLSRRHALDKLQGLGYRVVRAMALPAQGVDNKRIYAIELSLLVWGEVVHIGKVGQRPKAEAYGAETLGVFPDDGGDIYAVDVKATALVYGV